MMWHLDIDVDDPYAAAAHASMPRAEIATYQRAFLSGPGRASILRPDVALGLT